MEEFYNKKNLFGKEIEIVIRNIEHLLGKEVIEDVYNYGLKLQKIFNFFDKNSELSKLNTRRRLEVSQDLLIVMKDALKLCELTKGKYDISLGKQIAQRKKALKMSPLKCSYKNIKIKGDTTILTHNDVMIDLGSIAKGYIVDKMIKYLINLGISSGLIDARGDIRVFGNYEELIDIQHPRKKDEIICTIKLKDLSVATSGDYNQFYGTYKTSHIINKNNLISITVIAPTLKEADVYATALFVLNKIERERIIKENSKIKVLTIDSNLDINYYNGFEYLIIRGEKYET